MEKFDPATWCCRPQGTLPLPLSSGAAAPSPLFPEGTKNKRTEGWSSLILQLSVAGPRARYHYRLVVEPLLRRPYVLKGPNTNRKQTRFSVCVGLLREVTLLSCLCQLAVFSKPSLWHLAVKYPTDSGHVR